MRRLLLCGVAVFGMGFEASAADMPDFLRGSSTVVAGPIGPRWDGFYVGGVVGWSVPGVDFTNDKPYVDQLARLGGATSVTAHVIGSKEGNPPHFGGCVGYQQQWDGAGGCLEATYNWLNKGMCGVNADNGSF